MLCLHCIALLLFVDFTHPQGRTTATATATATAVSAFESIEIQNYKFFHAESGTEFVVRGIDYYPRPNRGILDQNSIDYFSWEHRSVWERDIPYLQELGVNAIRLYAVNTTLHNHDAFMCRLQQAGIYVIVALAHDCPVCAITKEKAPDCYPPELKRQGQDIIRTFAKYPNVLAFSAGNEVNHYAPPNQPQWNAPCQKKFLRDMRAYVASCPHMRRIPIGIVSADSERQNLTLYYNCQDNPNDPYQHAEWYGLNSYVFCDGNVTDYDHALGFQTLIHDYESYNYSIPAVMTEFGCISDSFPDLQGYPHQRTFLQAQWMFDQPDVRNVFAGGFAFEYSMELANGGTPMAFSKQNFGVGYLAPNDCDEITVPCTYHPLPCFDTLKRAYRYTDIVHLAHRDNFTVPPERTGRSTCPEGYPALSDFVWKADSLPDMGCPRPGRDTAFSCPADLWLPPDAAGASGGVFLVGVFVVVVALMIVALAVSRKKGRTSYEFVNHTPMTSDSENDGLLSMPKVGGYRSLGNSSDTLEE